MGTFAVTLNKLKIFFFFFNYNYVFVLFYSEKYQKIRSPVKRSEIHFDAGAKFHVPSDFQYLNYFIAHVLEFQLLRSSCLVAGQYEPNNSAKPLHKCDIDGSLEAGKRIRAGLSLGLSKHWSDALSIMTDGEREIKADALLEYFKPLHEFLKIENERISKSNKIKIISHSMN